MQPAGSNLSAGISCLLLQACDRVWAAICSGAAEADPRLLQTAVLLTHCDLKHYKYRYWFAFPALQPPQPFALAAQPASLAAALGGEAAAAAVAAACSSFVASSGLPAWLVHVGADADSTGAGITTVPLTAWEHLQQQPGGSNSGPQLFLAVADSSALPENPGWPLRNLLLMAAARWGSLTGLAVVHCRYLCAQLCVWCGVCSSCTCHAGELLGRLGATRPTTKFAPRMLSGCTPTHSTSNPLALPATQVACPSPARALPARAARRV